VEMEEEELKIHHEALKRIQKDLRFAQANEVVVSRMRMMSRTYMCCNFN
jgi:hypothetical protein